MSGSSSSSREGSRIYWRTVMILALILLIVAGVGFRVLYMMSLDRARDNLTELAQAQARIMESVAKFDAYFQSGKAVGAARSATLSQFKEGQRAFLGFGKTGEIMLAERVGDELVYLLPARKLGFRTPPPVNLSADEAGPMKAALDGGSGTIIALDYRGDRVLAAYEWMPFMEMGLVTKIDLQEFKQPFYRSAAVTAMLALFAILIGAALNRKAVSPLINQIVLDAGIIRERESNYRRLVATIPGIVYMSDLDSRMTMHEISNAIVEVAGYPAVDFLEDGKLDYADIILPEDRPDALVTEPGAYELDYRIQRPDGKIRWIADHGTVEEDESGRATRKGILIDITARKKAEHALKDLQTKLSRYISPQVYKSIFRGQQDVQVGSTRKKLTLFFSDIVNFTVKSESLDPDDLTLIINSYLNRMSEIAVKHGGTLDKFIGDGVVIFFGDPESRGIRQDAAACLSMALEMLHEVESLNQEALAQGVNSPIQIRIGVATGYCTVGNFGSESRMDYTVLGRTVNLAARLEAAAPSDGILVSSETALLIDEQFVTEPVEPVQVKGFEKPVEVFRVLRMKNS